MTTPDRLPHKDPARPRLVHLTTTDMSLDWLLGPQLCAFAEAGYEVIGMSAAGKHVAHLESMGIVHVAVPSFTRSTNPLQDVKAFFQLFRLLRQVRLCIVTQSADPWEGLPAAHSGGRLFGLGILSLQAARTCGGTQGLREVPAPFRPRPGTDRGMRRGRSSRRQRSLRPAAR